MKTAISQNRARKDVALAVIYGAQSQNLIAPNEALETSYLVTQRSSSSAAGHAVSMLSARFAAGSNELALIVRKDQDLIYETERLERNITAALLKLPAERNLATEQQMRERIEQINSERDKLQDVFNQRFPNYVALSKPQPLSAQNTQALLADDEALVTVDLNVGSWPNRVLPNGAKGYVWAITKGRAEWRQLSVDADTVSKEVASLRASLDPNSAIPFDRNIAYQLYRQVLGPIEDVISNKNRISFVLNGALTSLPPQLLITSDPEGRKSVSVLACPQIRNYCTPLNSQSEGTSGR